MLILTDTRTAYELAGIADAASKDSTRPILTNVKVDVVVGSDHGVTMTVVATDSHILAWRTVSFTSDQVLIEEDDASHFDENGLMLNAKAWKKALKETAVVKGPGDVLIGIDAEGENVTITRDLADVAEVRLTTQEGSFPKWKTLYSGQHYDGELNLPAFNPTLIGRIPQFVSAKPADRDKQFVQMAATDMKGSHFKPWLFTGERGEANSFGVLVMPANTGREVPARSDEADADAA